MVAWVVEDNQLNLKLIKDVSSTRHADDHLQQEGDSP